MMLLNEYGAEGCKGKDADRSGPGALLIGNLARAARLLSQVLGAPTEGAGLCLESVIRYLASHPRGVLMFRRGAVEEPLGVWADSSCFFGGVPSGSQAVEGTSSAVGGDLPSE